MPIDKIPHIRLFKGLTRDEAEIIAGHCRKMRFEKGQILINEGAAVNHLCLVAKGQLRVFLPERVEGLGKVRPADVSLNMLDEGDCLGEHTLVDREPASASVVAVEAGELICISQEDLEQILVQSDRIARRIYHNLLGILIERLREKDMEIDLLLLHR